MSDVIWQARTITIATERGPEESRGTGPVGTDWVMGIRGGRWAITHVPTGAKAGEVDCPLVAVMMVHALSTHFPSTSASVELRDFLAGLFMGAKKDPDLDGTRMLVLTAVMNRMGLDQFMPKKARP